jgi:hypothetical protein
MPTSYTTNPGDCLASIAAAHGIASWKEIYDFEANGSLRDALKGDPNHVEPGLTIQLPDPPKHKVSDSGKLDIKLTAPDEVKLRLVLQKEDGSPAKSCRYELVIGPKEVKGQSDGSGAIECPLDPAAVKGHLRFWPGGDDEEPEEIDLQLGQLPPGNTIAGAQARLANLGYYSGEIDGLAGPQTEAAVRAFQLDAGQRVTGQLDAGVRDQIARLHDAEA